MKVRIGNPPRVAVVGKSGTGKTTLCRVLVEGLRPRVTVWDPVRQYPADIAYRPRDLGSRQEAEGLARWARSRAPWSLLYEEAEQVLDQGRGPLPPALNEYVLVGRNWRLGWIVNVRRPQALHKTVLDEVDDIYIFKVEGRALDYAVSRLGSDVGPRLRAMQAWPKDAHQFYWYHEGDLEGPLTLDLKRPAADGQRRGTTGNDENLPPRTRKGTGRRSA
jgi:energy-coupling factor transporter ATP-binding protein EcfA2